MPDSWLDRLVPLPRIQFLIMLILVSGTVVSGLFYGNGSVLLGGGLMVSVTVLWIISQLTVYRLRKGPGCFSGKYDSDPYRSGSVPFRDFSWGLVVFFGPGVISLVFTAFVFSAPVSKAVFVADGRTTGRSGWMLAVPFLEDIRSIPLEPHASFRAVATTKDGKQIEGQLTAAIKLVSDETELMKAIRETIGANRGATQQLEEELKQKFKEAVATHELAELPNNLVLEWETGSQISRSLLTIAGLEWSGTLKVQDLHAYFAEVDK